MTCLYVVNLDSSSVTVYPDNANGDVAPLETISGPYTGLVYPDGVAVDSAGEIYVSNSSVNSSAINVYARGSNGDVAPIRTISGPKTGLTDPLGVAVAHDGTIYVVNVRTVIGSGGRYGYINSIMEYAPGADGDVAPVRTISGTKTRLFGPHFLALDSDRRIHVTNYNCFDRCSILKNAVDTYGAKASGDVGPFDTIEGAATQLDSVSGIALDKTFTTYVTNRFTPSITVYPPGANKDQAPIRVISGLSTGLEDPRDIALDLDGAAFVSNPDSITVYAPGASGNASPIQTIFGSNTGLSSAVGIAIH